MENGTTSSDRINRHLLIDNFINFRLLTALLRLVLALLHTSGFRLTGERLPDGRAKTRILRAVDRAHEYLQCMANR